MAGDDLVDGLKTLIGEMEEISAKLTQLQSFDASNLAAATLAAFEFTAKAAAVARDAASLSARLELRGASNGKGSKPR
jgi:hypothetical protein